MIRIHENLSLDEAALRFTFTTSQGPGGQNVNKVATRAVLSLDLNACTSLTPVQQSRIRSALSGRISKQGLLRIVCGKGRTQEANRRAALALLYKLVEEALRPVAVRRATRPSRASREKRLSAKRDRSQRKAARRPSRPDEGG